MNDLPLFASRSTAPDGVPEDVAEKFLVYALEAKHAGQPKYGSKAICEAIRWHEQIRKGNREFKLNNNWTAPLARWAMQARPELRGFFETRERHE